MSALVIQFPAHDPRHQRVRNLSERRGLQPVTPLDLFGQQRQLPADLDMRLAQSAQLCNDTFALLLGTFCVQAAWANHGMYSFLRCADIIAHRGKNAQPDITASS